MQDQIGGGGFSLVYRGTWLGTPVAIKKWFDPNITDELVQEFRAEVMTLQALRHPNVLQFLGACSKPPQLAMVTEHLNHSLHSVLYQSNTAMDKARVVAVAQDIARAFVYLHSRKPAVIHRDIKPANFLLDRAWKVKVRHAHKRAHPLTHTGPGGRPSERHRRRGGDGRRCATLGWPAARRRRRAPARPATWRPSSLRAPATTKRRGGQGRMTRRTLLSPKPRLCTHDDRTDERCSATLGIA